MPTNKTENDNVVFLLRFANFENNPQYWIDQWKKQERLRLQETYQKKPKTFEKECAIKKQTIEQIIDFHVDVSINFLKDVIFDIQKWREHYQENCESRLFRYPIHNDHFSIINKWQKQNAKWIEKLIEHMFHTDVEYCCIFKKLFRIEFGYAYTTWIERWKNDIIELEQNFSNATEKKKKEITCALEKRKKLIQKWSDIMQQDKIVF
jgi:hypothetical protein